MTNLENLISEFCPNGVVYAELKDVAKIAIGEFVHKNKQTIDGQYPVYNGGTANTGFYDDFNRTANKIIISARGANAGYVNRVFTNFWSGNSCYSVDITDNNVDWNYVYYCLKSGESKLLGEQQKGSIPAVSKKQVEQFRIPLPPLPVQQEIVRILDNFTELTAELNKNLEEELAARQKQYEHYRDELLRQGTITHYGKIIDMLVQPITDGPHTTPTLVEKGIPFLSAEAVFDGRIHFNKKRGFITEEFDSECCRKYKPQRDDVLMVKSGSTTGKVGYVDTDERFNVWSPLAAMRVNAKNSPRFLFHLLQSEHVQKQVRTKASHGSQPNLSMRALEQFDVPIPSFDVQEEIAAVLDNLDALCNDLASGLPAEIATRQKQYEYYRDKLLTFKELEG